MKLENFRMNEDEKMNLKKVEMNKNLYRFTRVISYKYWAILLGSQVLSYGFCVLGI